MSGNAVERGALGSECDLELRGFVVSWTSSTWSTHPSTSTASVVLCRFQRGDVVYCTTVLSSTHITLLYLVVFALMHSDMRFRKFASSNLRVAFREGCPLKTHAAAIRDECLN